MDLLTHSSSLPNSLLHDLPDSRNLGLPGATYFQEAIFEQELRSLWTQTWQMVGREAQIANPGDYFSCVVGDQPLFIIRTQAGDLQAFHNVCPHRGARLVADQGCVRQIRCSYHAWRFDFEGNLLGLPQAERFATLDRETVRLSAVQIDTWGGFIFVNLATGGECLQTYLAGFSAYLEQYEYPWSALELSDRWDYEEPVNWKFLVENYLESYHLSTVHGKSLQCFDPRNIQAAPLGRHYQICVGYAPQEVEHHPVFAGQPQGYSYQGFVFPNWMVNTAKDNVSIFRLIPLSATRTRFEVSIYQTRSQQTAFPYQRDRFRAEFERVLQEDFQAVRLLQASARSEAYRVGQFAAGLEDGISHFHSGWLQALTRLKGL